MGNFGSSMFSWLYSGTCCRFLLVCLTYMSESRRFTFFQLGEIENREREGSTGPSRGEQRLTVYRAHASREYLAARSVDFDENRTRWS